jgi:hypothetical protein
MEIFMEKVKFWTFFTATPKFSQKSNMAESKMAESKMAAPMRDDATHMKFD